jgi:hypothetical protein
MEVIQNHLSLSHPQEQNETSVCQQHGLQEEEVLVHVVTTVDRTDSIWNASSIHLLVTLSFDLLVLFRVSCFASKRWTVRPKIRKSNESNQSSLLFSRHFIVGVSRSSFRTVYYDHQ